MQKINEPYMLTKSAEYAKKEIFTSAEKQLSISMLLRLENIFLQFASEKTFDEADLINQSSH